MPLSSVRRMRAMTKHYAVEQINVVQPGGVGPV
jgi:hypothetical protein